MSQKKNTNEDDLIENEDIAKEEKNKNHKGFMSKIGKFFKKEGTYFGSEWSFAKFKVSDSKSICCFGPNDTIIVIGDKGKYYQAEFNKFAGGDCEKIAENKFELNA